MDRGVAIVVGACLLLAACGGSGSDSDASTTAAASPTTTVAVTTTTDPPATTSDAPATTIDTDAQLAAAEQAYLDAFDAYIAAARDPSNPDLRAEIERLYTGPSLEFTISQLDGFVRENWVARPAERTIQNDDSRWRRSSCPTERTSSSWWLARSTLRRFVEVGGAPDGSDALVTDEVTVDRLVSSASKLVDGAVEGGQR